jgi:hypothetical protein
MCSAPRSGRAFGVVVAIVIVTSTPAATSALDDAGPRAADGARAAADALTGAVVAATIDGLTATEVVRRADAFRGLGGVSRFIARVSAANDGGEAGAAPPTVVEVRANGFAAQLVVVLEPNRGDVLLATPDVVWLRPRRLHRLTRIPPELRMFDGASIADVTAVDLLASYTARFAEPPLGDDAGIVVELRASNDGVRYPRAIYRLDARCRPARIDFMTANATTLKTLTYAAFTVVASRSVASTLVVDDRVHHDRTIVTLSDFERLPDGDPASFTPEAVLAMPDLAS